MSITEGIVYYLSFVAAITVVAMAILLVASDMRNCTANAKVSGAGNEDRTD